MQNNLLCDVGKVGNVGYFPGPYVESKKVGTKGYRWAPRVPVGARGGRPGARGRPPTGVQLSMC